MAQTLVLSVATRQAAEFGSRSRKLFEGTGGSIGRSEDCDWVLSATGVSRVHAMIRLLNGIYFIEDRSTNGMLLNGAPLRKGEPSALKDGDRLLIDTFEIEVHLQDSAAAAAAAQPAEKPAEHVEDPLDFALFGSTPGAGAKPSAADSSGSLIPGSPGAASSSAADLDPLSFLGQPVSEAPADSGLPEPSWNHTPGTADYFKPPMTGDQRQANALPENWDLTMGDFSAKPPPAPTPTPARPAPPPASPPPQPQAAPVGSLPPDVERIFRIVIDGTMDVLRARAEIKATFRLPVTVIQRSENNPLKFAPNADDALQKIMGPQNSAFLSGTAAFEDAFDDIRCHQMAMLAGVRAAYESLLANFNPERYEREVDGVSKRSTFRDFAGKGKYWDKYRERFEGISQNPDECFRHLFGDEFARAYEEQLARLKSARRRQHGV